MTKKIVVFTALAGLLFASCQHDQKADVKSENSEKPMEVKPKTSDVPFSLAKNYFVLNTVGILDNPKIETSEKFKQTFGMATRMGSDGKPTAIDFDTQFVIGVILPETDTMTTIEPVSLQKDEHGKLTFTYRKVVAQKLSATIRPSIQVIVSKADDGIVALREVSQN